MSKIFNTFEQLKFASIKILNYVKIKHSIPPFQTPPGTSIITNVLEAVAQDLSVGNGRNADVGLELLQPPMDNRDEWAPHAEDLGVLGSNWKWAREWSDLYTSWNLAFVTSQFPDTLMFYAKLMNPMTFGLYHAEGAQGMFIYPRCITLYLHLQYILERRVEAYIEEPDRPLSERFSLAQNDWGNPMLAMQLSKLNEDAAQKFRDEKKRLGIHMPEGTWHLGSGTMGWLKSAFKTVAGLHKFTSGHG